MTLRWTQLFAVYFDDVRPEVGLAAQFRNDMAIHGDATLLNHFLSLTAGRDTSMRKDLLKPFLHDISV
jgi:hypothetical protein